MYRESVVKAEISFPGPLANGATGMPVRRVQEWLSIQNFGTAVDGDFGDATEAALRAYQSSKGFSANGRLSAQTWDALTEPLRAVTSEATTPSGLSFPRAVLRLAKLHLARRPIEAGGDNRGPWVRLYMQGNDGPDWPWCAGFVSTLIHQASRHLASPVPIPGSVSCDTLAAQARGADRFIRGADLDAGRATVEDLGSCALFLVRRTSSDWTHVGFAFDFGPKAFSTIEGNTNDDGSANGFAVFRRTRGYSGKDFVRLT